MYRDYVESNHLRQFARVFDQQPSYLHVVTAALEATMVVRLQRGKILKSDSVTILGESGRDTP